ncbi:BON domain-containing protein [Myxococcota bacterium]|nr:BON domain-containing protein [Myxococcota bacterium]
MTFVVGLAGIVGPANSFTPYRLLVQAVRSPENPRAFVEDKRLKSKLRRALILSNPSSTLSVEPYVAGGHAYLVGWVEDDEERQRIEEAARGVQGLLSLAIYLPTRPTGPEAPSTTNELKLQAKLRLSLREQLGGQSQNIDVQVVGHHAVLIGVLRSSSEIEQAVGVTRGTEGVSGVTSFLSIPLSGDAKRIGILR